MRGRWLLGLVCAAMCVAGSAPLAGADDVPPARALSVTALGSGALGAPPAGGMDDATDASDLPAAGTPIAVPDEPPPIESEAPVPDPDTGVPPGVAPAVPVEDSPPAADPTPAEILESVPFTEPVPEAPLCRPARRGCCGQVYDECGWALDSCGRRYGRWVLSLEGGMAVIDDPEGLVGPATGLATQMRWDMHAYDFTFSGRVGLQYAPSARDRVLLRFTRYGSWDDSALQSGVVGFTAVPGGPVVSTPPDGARSQTEADLFGGELHWQHELCASQCVRWDVGLGLRVLRLEEMARLDGFRGGGPAFVQADVDNTFRGVQLGGTVHYDHSRDVTLFLGVKGLLGSIDRDVRVSDNAFFIGGLHAAENDDSEFAWGVDAEVGLRWRVARNVVLGASYNLLFLDNIVHATDAMDFTQAATGAVQARQLTDDLLVHAFWVGVHFNF